MKTLEWQNFFAEQRALGKVVVSVAELANAAQTTLHAVNTELGRLVKSGVVCRYAHGQYYGLTEGVGPEHLVSALDVGAYITGFYALFRHRLVTQVPAEVTCFTNRRHNRRTDRDTPAGRVKFICVPASIYAKPGAQVLAAAEQALCDFVWLTLREGADPQSLVTFQNLQNLTCLRLEKALRRYPANVRHTVSQLPSLRRLAAC